MLLRCLLGALGEGVESKQDLTVMTLNGEEDAVRSRPGHTDLMEIPAQVSGRVETIAGHHAHRVDHPLVVLPWQSIEEHESRLAAARRCVVAPAPADVACGVIHADTLVGSAARGSDDSAPVSPTPNAPQADVAGNATLLATVVAGRVELRGDADRDDADRGASASACFRYVPSGVRANPAGTVVEARMFRLRLCGIVDRARHGAALAPGGQLDAHFHPRDPPAGFR